MANNKVQLADGTVLIDLTDTTAKDSDVAKGKYFYNAAGVRTPGTAEGGSGTPYVLITGEQDAGGGKILHITGAVDETISADSGGGDIDAMSATVLLDISDLTVTASHLEQGYTAVDSMGRPVVGTLVVSGDAPVLGTKTITENGTYEAEDDALDGYSSVVVNVPATTPNLQSKAVTPSTSQQTISPDSGYDGLSSVVVNAIQIQTKSVTPSKSVQTVTPDSGKFLDAVTVSEIPSEYIVPSGSQTIEENGTYDVTDKESVTVTVPESDSLNIQVAQSTTRIANTAYTEACSLICSKTGTYDVYWDCFRSTTSGTSGSRLYIDGATYSSANTTFSSQAQNNHLTGVPISAGQEVAVYCRSRATNYYAYCGQLTIVQTA